jgi:RNase P/RNase MRP subunit p30
MNDLVLTKEKQENLNFSKISRVTVKKIKNLKELRKLKKTDINIIKGSKFNREVLENKYTDILLDPYAYIKKDSLHHRNSGLNHILCKIAYRNKKIIALSFSEILKNKKRENIFERIKQIIKLCRKYKINIIFSSFAENKWEMRDAKDLLNFAIFIGMTPGEAKKALSFDIQKYKEEKLKEIMPGIRNV